MNCFDVLAYTRDGCAYCDECGAGLPDDGETGVVFGDAEDVDGMTCWSCKTCLIDGEWWPAPPTPTLVRWSTCGACNVQRPWRRGARRYRDAIRAAARDSLVCADCRRPAVHFGGER